MSEQRSGTAGLHPQAGNPSHPLSTTTVAPNTTDIRPTTPPGHRQAGQTTSSASLNDDTPRSDRVASRHNVASIERIRKILADTMAPDILEGPLDNWLRTYTSDNVGLPQVEKIISSLKSKGLVRDVAGTLSWKDFPDKPSVLSKRNKQKKKSATKDSSSATIDATAGAVHAQESTATGTNEHDIFKPLGPIIDAIAEVDLANLSPSCKYKHEPKTTESEVSGAQHRVDGHLYLLESRSPPAPEGSRLPTSDVAVTFEYKCDYNLTNLADNRWKALYSAFHVLHSDCQRKHTYSITIDDDRVSLWYFSRSHSAKTKDFSLLDVRTVVRALSALIFSTVEDLGYDSDIRRIVEKDEKTKKDRIRYIYHLGDRYFKTLNCRDEYDDLYIAGRATRVWEVIEVASFDNPSALPNAQIMVLRDVWLEHGSSTEREIQEKIFERCDELGREFPAPNDDRLRGVDDATRELLHQRLKDASYKELFLTIEKDHRGALSKPVAEGFMPAPDVYFEPLYINQEAKRAGSDPRRASTARTSDPTVPPTLPVQQASAPREYNPRQHNFIVYREVCSALHELDDLHDVVQGLLDVLLALQILFMISWIHRDVSAGNILLYRGRGKLGDLEYAKEFNLSVGRRSSDPKTGTQIFMAVELQTNDTICQEVPADFDDVSQDTDPTDTNTVVRHNFQHDVESIFWILLWILFTRVPDQDCADINATLFHSKNLFFYPRRRQILTKDKFLNEILRRLRQGLPSQLLVSLRTLRATLYSSYVTRATSFEDRATYAPIYGKLRRSLESIAASVPHGRVRLVQPASPLVGSRSSYAPRTDIMHKKLDCPEDVMLAPHKQEAQKRPREESDESHPEKRPARG